MDGDQFLCETLNAFSSMGFLKKEIPGGVLVMSNWQFDRVERLRRKIAPWSVIGVDAAAMDEGDALVDWRRGGEVGYRYCHLLSPTEIRRLAEESDFRVGDQFTADGGMNLFSVLKA